VYEEFGKLEDYIVGDIPLTEEYFKSTMYDKDTTTFSAMPKKHSDDFYFTKAALKHPMRTMNPEEAKIFFVPVPYNVMLDHIHRERTRGKICLGDICQTDLVLYIDYLLGKSPWFQRSNGADHIAVASSFGWGHAGRRGQHNNPFHKRDGSSEQEFYRSGQVPKNLLKCNRIIFEDWDSLRTYAEKLILPKGSKRHYLSTMYVGNACDVQENKTTDFAMIAAMKPENPNFHDREVVCRLIQEESDYSMPVCGYGQQCPALADAKFGFHVRGDSFGADRLFGTLLSGTVPIFTRKEQYDIIPDWIDWDSISYFVDILDEKSTKASLKAMLEDEELYQTKHAAVLRNRNLFDFEGEHLVPFDHYMYTLQSKLYPETIREVKTRYDALKLPPMESPSRLNRALNGMMRRLGWA